MAHSDNKEILWQGLWREHTLYSYLRVSGWLHASLVNSPLERWVSGQLVVYFVNEVLLVSSHGWNTIYMFPPSCACLALNTSCHPLRSGIPGWAMKLLGKREYRLVHSLQWASGGIGCGQWPFTSWVHRGNSACLVKHRATAARLRRCWGCSCPLLHCRHALSHQSCEQTACCSATDSVGMAREALQSLSLWY